MTKPTIDDLAEDYAAELAAAPEPSAADVAHVFSQGRSTGPGYDAKLRRLGARWTAVLHTPAPHGHLSEDRLSLVCALVKRNFTSGEIWTALAGSAWLPELVRRKGERHATELIAMEIAKAQAAVEPFPPDEAYVRHSASRHTAATPTTIDEVIATFRRHLYLPDATPLLAVLGAVAANMQPGDPTWLLMVGPPSSGKTEILQAVRDVEHVHPAATLTEAALLSGTPKRDATGSGGLLRDIGAFGIILAKDFGSVLSMNRDTRAQLLAALREVYDGEWTRHLGTDGGKTLHWAGKVGLIAGCTGEIDRHHVVIAAMGERFLTCRMPDANPEQLARRALVNVRSIEAMRAELGAAVAGIFARELREPVALADADAAWLARLATFVATCRSAVDRDTYSREIELIPGAEAPGRLATSLARLLSALQSIGVEHAEARRVTGTVALDSMPAIRRTAIEYLATLDAPALTDAIALRAGYPKTTMQRVLEDLTAYGMAVRSRAGAAANAPLAWKLSDRAAELYRAATCSPEMSGADV